MSLQSTFKQFLASPSTSLLAENAAIQYITTLITIHGPAEIIKHLSTQGNQLKKKQEEFLDVVEGQNALAAEVETTLEFISSGGAYLPGLDDNFLADRTVTFPIVSSFFYYNSVVYTNMVCSRFTLSALMRAERLRKSDKTGIRALFSS
jgi:hypothetical protein